MSKNNNVNPGQYKVAGRERPGEDIVQSEHKQRLAENRSRTASGGKTRVPNQAVESSGARKAIARRAQPEAAQSSRPAKKR